MGEQQTLDKLFSAALAEAAGNDAKAIATKEPPKGSRGYPMGSEQGEYVAKYLRANYGAPDAEYIEGYLYTTAPQERVERVMGYAEEARKRDRKRRAEEEAKTKTYRYSVRCRFCKGKWMEDFSYDQVRQIPVYGLRHHCPKIDGVRDKIAAEARARMKQLGEGEESFDKRFAERWSQYDMFVAEPLRWKNTGAPTECGARCMSATGPNCDCKCRGKNHGANKVA